MRLLDELRRRNVIRMAGLYLVGAWLITQVSSTVLPMFDAPAWLPRTIVILLAVGFVPALAFAWAFELTPQGFRLDASVPAGQSIGRQTARRMDRLIVCGLLVLIALMLGERIWFAERRAGAPAKPLAAAPRPASAAPPNSIAVLAFADLSQEQNQSYFSDGMAEEILNALARIKTLKVIARGSSFQFKGKDIGPGQIGAELGVAHILEGSVRKQGEALRITAKLIEAADGVQQWSKIYDGRLADVFDLQERCARDIAAQLKVVLAGGEQRLVDKVTDNPQAYALFVEAQTLVSARFGDSLPRAIAKLDAAIGLDPRFGRAWSKKAVAYAVLSQYVGGDWAPNWRASEQATQRALELDPNDAEAYAVRSYTLFSQHRYVDMVEPMRRALELEPDNATARYWEANEVASVGRTADADALVDALMVIEPTNARVLFYKAMMRWRAGDAATLLTLGRRLQALGSPFGGYALSFYSASVGDCDTGAKLFAEPQRLLGSTIALADVETIYRGICAGGTARGRALAILDAHATDQWTPTLFLQIGEPERAFAGFERGDTGLSDGYLNWLWQSEGWSRKARQSPAFQGFAQRIGLVDYWKRHGWPDLCHAAPETGVDAFACQ